MERGSDYRAIVENAGEVITVLDDDGRILYENQAVERILGYDPVERVGTSVFSAVHPNDRERVHSEFQRALQQPDVSTVRFECQYRQSDDTWLWVESVLSTQQAKTAGEYVLTTRSVEHRKERERTRHSAAERLKAIFEASPNAVIELDQDGVVTRWSSGAEQMFGWSASAVIGEKLPIIPDEQRDAFIRKINRVFAGETIAGLERTRQTKDGKRLDVSISIAPICGDNESVVGAMAIYTNITPQKERERTLSAQKEELTLLNRIIRHDIRNDMTIVLGWLELLKEDVPDEHSTDIERVTDASQHVIELTYALRDITQALEKGYDLDLVPVNINDVLKAELERIRSSYPNVTIDEPDWFEGKVLADPMLSSVFRNLLNNAVQHNDTNEPEIDASIESHSETIRIRIADNGPGVPDDQKDEIFGRDEKGLQSGGAGVGLYLVDTLIDAYDGEVWVEDNDPRGAVFVIELQRSD